MKVALVGTGILNNTYEEEYGATAMQSPAVGLVAGYLKENGVDIDTYDTGHYPSNSNWSQYDMIGVSVCSYNSLPLLKRIIDEAVGPVIVVGGAFFSSSIFQQQAVEDVFELGVDYAVMGCGEEAFLRLIRAGDPRDIPNLVYRNYNSELVFNPVKYVSHNALVRSYFSPEHLEKQPVLFLPVLTTNRCYWGKCNFCQYRYYTNTSHNDADIFRQAFQRLVDEYKHYNKPMFIDTVSDALPYRYLDAIKHTPGMAQIHKILATIRIDDDFSKFIEALPSGRGIVYTGVEALPDRLRAIAGKGSNEEVVKSCILKARECDITFSASTIIDIPTATKEEIEYTHNFLFEHTSCVSPYKTIIYRGTQWAEEPDSFGIEITAADDPEKWSFIYDEIYPPSYLHYKETRSDRSKEENDEIVSNILESAAAHRVNFAGDKDG